MCGIFDYKGHLAWRSIYIDFNFMDTITQKQFALGYFVATASKQVFDPTPN
jgi:hypothetical protein